jgi:hypothetical protein
VTPAQIFIDAVGVVTGKILGDRFQPGPWNLGRWSRPIGIVAITGPEVQGSEEEPAATERDLESI